MHFLVACWVQYNLPYFVVFATIGRTRLDLSVILRGYPVQQFVLHQRRKFDQHEQQIQVSESQRLRYVLSILIPRSCLSPLLSQHLGKL